MNTVTQPHNTAREEFLNTDPETTIRILWDGQENYRWNEICADIVEVFGLPGGRFISHPTPNSMAFHFKSKKDADLCRIMVSHQL